jgi:hypothetical protein
MNFRVSVILGGSDRTLGVKAWALAMVPGLSLYESGHSRSRGLPFGGRATFE